MLLGRCHSPNLLGILFMSWTAFAFISGCGPNHQETTTPDSASDLPGAETVFLRAKQAMGGVEALEEVTSIKATAACTGPTGDFETVVHSASDNRTFFHQTYANDDKPFTAVVRDTVGWVKDPTRETYSLLRQVDRAGIRGHEFHLMTMAVEQRFTEARTIGHDQFNGQACLVVRLTDEMGKPALVYFREDNGLMAGMRLKTPGDQQPDSLLITFDAWSQVGRLLLVDKLTVTHGLEVWTYDYTNIELNAVDEERFEVPSEVTTLLSG